MSTCVEIRPEMAENGDKNDRVFLERFFWSDFENVFSTPPRHDGSERLPEWVPTAKSQLSNTPPKARVHASARPRATGRPALPAAGNSTRGFPPGSARGVFFAGVAGPEFAVRRRAAPCSAVPQASEQVVRQSPTATAVPRVRPRTTGRPSTPAAGNLTRGSP